jgi:hypothetical protein
MDKNKMLEAFRQRIRSKSTDQLIEDLREYNIQVVSCTLGGLGSISILGDEGDSINSESASHLMDMSNKSIDLNMEFVVKSNIKFPMQKIDGSNIKDSGIIKDTDKYNCFPFDWGFVA